EVADFYCLWSTALLETPSTLLVKPRCNCLRGSGRRNPSYCTASAVLIGPDRPIPARLHTARALRYFLNLVPVEFSNVTGIYVATLFVVFQITDFVFFGVYPTPAVLVGGAFIVAGGFTVALG